MNKYLHLLLTLLPFFIGCSGCDDEPNSSPEIILVKKITYQKVGEKSFNFTFLYDGNKLKTVNENGTLKENYIYEGEKLTRINFFNLPTGINYLEIDYDSNTAVTKFTEYNQNNQIAMKHLISYTANTITDSVFSGSFDFQNIFEYSKVRLLGAGNVVSETIAFNGVLKQSTYEFDNSEHPFKNRSNFSVFQILDLDMDFNSNNQIRVSNLFKPEEGFTTTVKYNSQKDAIQYVNQDINGKVMATYQFYY